MTHEKRWNVIIFPLNLPVGHPSLSTLSLCGLDCLDESNVKIINPDTAQMRERKREKETDNSKCSINSAASLLHVSRAHSAAVYQKKEPIFSTFSITKNNTSKNK